MSDYGALCLSDFEFRTLQDHTMTKEEQKSLLSVFENGSVVARYGDAIFPKDLPRTFSVNLGEDMITWGEERSGWLFRLQDGWCCESGADAGSAH